ncbi:MAG: thiol-disulfide isomerase [Candidatus Nomurabacteria bacterium]|nr:thiol-disulfide isomerase [Candidatus Nomurabacteria bacterium]
MTPTNKKITLGIVSLLIIVAIIFISAKKSPHIDSSTAPDVTAAVVASKAMHYPMAKELVAPAGFINSTPFKLSDLVGKKVILIDFWAYSCINCQRTIPYLNAWYDKYKDDGLVIVGVHAPEFDFEKNYANVAAAVQKAGITYPVVLDNDMGTWNAYNNQYWPNEYLIDIDGYVVHNHIGEGDYAATEQAIQAALTERAQRLGTNQATPTGIVDPLKAIPLDNNGVQSPETYFGAARNQYLANGTQGTVGNQTLTPNLGNTSQINALYLDGTWNFQNQYAETVSPTAGITYHYSAKHVYMVASAKNPVKLKITIDGQLPGINAGADVNADGSSTIQANRLYDLIDGTDYGSHTLHIEVQGAGLDAYTFTFG